MEVQGHHGIFTLLTSFMDCSRMEVTGREVDGGLNSRSLSEVPSGKCPE